MSHRDLDYAETLRDLILADKTRLGVLLAAERFQQQALLPDALLAAGFVRNCCWDYLHRQAFSPLNDVDLIYFDPVRLAPELDQQLQVDLCNCLPGLDWEVKNQARMSLKHADPAYVSSLDAMRYWPECETAVGIRIDGSRQIVSSYGLRSLFAGHITPAPHRDRAVCLQRVEKKQWLQSWPRLQVMGSRAAL